MAYTYKWSDELDGWIQVPKGKGKGKGKSEANRASKTTAKGKGKGKSPISKVDTSWFNCTGCRKGWCFKGLDVPDECKFCHSTFDMEEPYDYYGNPKSVARSGKSDSPLGNMGSPPQAADEPKPPPSEDKAVQMLKSLEARGLEPDDAKAFLAEHNIALPKPKGRVVIEKIALQVVKAENEVKRIDGLIDAQKSKYQRIHKEAEECHNKIDSLVNDIVGAKLKLQQLKDAQLADLKHDGISAAPTSNVREVVTCVGNNAARISTMLDHIPPAQEQSSWKANILSLLHDAVTKSQQLHDLSSEAEEEDEALPNAKDEDDDAFGTHAFPEVGQDDGQLFPEEWDEDAQDNDMVDAPVGAPQVVVPDEQFDSLKAAELKRINLQHMPSLDEAKLPASKKARLKGVRDPNKPPSGSHTPRGSASSVTTTH